MGKSERLGFMGCSLGCCTHAGASCAPHVSGFAWINHLQGMGLGSFPELGANPLTTYCDVFLKRCVSINLELDHEHTINFLDLQVATSCKSSSALLIALKQVIENAGSYMGPAATKHRCRRHARYLLPEIEKLAEVRLADTC